MAPVRSSAVLAAFGAVCPSTAWSAGRAGPQAAAEATGHGKVGGGALVPAGGRVAAGGPPP
eukprot:8986513-Lingulodinium_polyedra.AAC.1